jgi:hypothetical protein
MTMSRRGRRVAALVLALVLSGGAWSVGGAAMTGAAPAPEAGPAAAPVAGPATAPVRYGPLARRLEAWRRQRCLRTAHCDVTALPEWFERAVALQRGLKPWPIGGHGRTTRSTKPATTKATTTRRHRTTTTAATSTTAPRGSTTTFTSTGSTRPDGSTTRSTLATSSTEPTTTTTTVPECDPAARGCPRDATDRLQAIGIYQFDLMDMSDAGELVGFSYDDQTNGLRSFRMPASGPARILAGAPGDTTVEVHGVNATGTVVGYADNPEVGGHPLVWDAQDRGLDLAPKLPRFGGEFLYGYAAAVSNAGMVAGSYQLSILDPKATTTSTTSTTTRPWYTTTTNATNATNSTNSTGTTGTTATTGTTGTAGPPTTVNTGPWPIYREVTLGFVWDPATDAVRILNPEALVLGAASPWVDIEDIGDGRHVVGALDDRPVRWTPQADGTFAREDLSGAYGMAVAVDARGDAVGRATDEAHTARYWAAGSLTGQTLAPLPDGRPDDLPDASGLNDAGVIAGTINGTRDSDAANRNMPVRWASPTAPAEPLGTLGYPQIYVASLNGAGTIAGYADDSDGRRHLLIWDD